MINSSGIRVDPHIFADPDTGSQNVADLTDPDLNIWCSRLYILGDVNETTSVPRRLGDRSVV